MPHSRPIRSLLSTPKSRRDANPIFKRVHYPPIALIDFDVLLNENALLAQVALYGGLSTPSGEVR
jgi:hypothetical protein